MCRCCKTEFLHVSPIPISAPSFFSCPVSQVQAAQLSRAPSARGTAYVKRLQMENLKKN